MSLLRKVAKPSGNNNECSCTLKQSTGVFSVNLEPRSVDVRDQAHSNRLLQLQQSEHLQELFLPNMQNIAVHTHGNGFHVHPPEVTGKVAHLDQLHSLLDEHDLVARVQITPSAEHPAVAVSLLKEHVDTLLNSGTVDLHVPLHDGTFRLHSTRNGRITAAEFI